MELKSNLKVEDILSPASCKYFIDGKNRKEIEGFIMSHELAHIASALPFTGSFKKNSLLVHIDEELRIPVLRSGTMMEIASNAFITAGPS